MSLEEIYELFLQHPRVTTDSRNVPKDSIFFALKGPSFNGNAYATEALGKGAVCAIIDEEAYHTEEATILVPDVLECLQQLGTHHRRQSPAPVIALTGSNGKTTTKELIAAVLSQKYKTHATRGNLNNHIGVPLTLLQIEGSTEMAVVEMGANHQKEIAFLSSLAEPDFGYITNFGKAHLEGFGGVEGVIKGKSELYDHLIARGKTVFMNADDPIQREKLRDYPNVVGFSKSEAAFYNIQFMGADPFVRLEAEGTTIQSQLSGDYNFSNCAIAVLIGKHFGVPLPDIKTALEGYVPENNRSQLLQQGGLNIILDAYNANPSSMSAALKHLASLEAPKIIAILGDMFELGEDSPREHEEMATLAQTLGIDQVILVGEAFSKTNSNALRFIDFESLTTHLNDRPLTGPATVLIKASRGMALERVLEFL